MAPKLHSIILPALVFAAAFARAQAPNISYSSPQVLLVGTPVSISPTNTGGAVSDFPGKTYANGFSPGGMAADSAGNLYVTDIENNTIKKIPAGGGTPVIVASTAGGSRFIAIDHAGNIYFTDGSQFVQKIPAGGGLVVNIGPQLMGLNGIAVDAAGNVYAGNNVSDTQPQTITKISPGSGNAVVVGSADNSLEGLAVDASGNVYFIETGVNAVKKFPAGGGSAITVSTALADPTGLALDAAGNIYVSSLVGEVFKLPSGGGSPAVIANGLRDPSGVAVDASGNLYIAEASIDIKKNPGIRAYAIPFIPSLPAGLSFDNTTGTISGTPTSVTVGAVNYTVTAFNHSGSSSATISITVNEPKPTISYSSPQTYAEGAGIAPLAPTSSSVAAAAYSGTPVALGSGFSAPAGLAADTAGNVYVADAGNNTVKKIPAGDGAPVTLGSGFNNPLCLAVDAARNVYVSDNGSNAVKEIPAGGGAVITLASGFNSPIGVAVDASGFVYVADSGNDAVKKIPPGGGAPVTLGSGFSAPYGVALDAYGNVYVADAGNNAIKKIPAGGGAIVTLGSRFKNPYGVAVDASGNVFVADFGNRAVKEIPETGHAPIRIAAFGPISPTGVAVDAANNVYMTGIGLTGVDEIKPVGGYYVSPALPSGLKFANATGIISGTPTAISPATNYTITAYNISSSASTTVNINVLPYTSDANLSNLQISSGTLKPAFTTWIKRYTAIVPYTVTSITVTPATIVAGATVKVNGTTVSPGSASAPITLAIGSNTITTMVTARDGTSTATYITTVYRGSSNAALSNLKLSSGVLSPAFVYTTTGYTARVINTVASILLTPTAADANAVIKVNGTVVASKSTSAPIPLSTGPNMITIAVTSQNGLNTDTYTLTVYKGSNNAALSNLKLSDGTLSPAFAYKTTAYSATVISSVTFITVTPASADRTATIKVNGIAVASRNASPPIQLSPGQNTITVTVASQNGLTTNTYTIVVTRAAATLSSLTLGATPLSPVFASGITSYTAKVLATVSAISETPTATDPNATIKVNGVTVASGSTSAPISLNLGPNVINTVVTSSDRTIGDAYKVTVYKGSNNAALSNLKLSAGTLSPAFVYTTTGYTATVDSSVASITVTPTAADATATIKVNGTVVVSKSASPPISLSTGQNTITVTLASQNGLTTDTYTITVYKGHVNAALSNLMLSSGTLSPAFAYATNSYTADVATAVNTITVTPTTADTDATITVNGMAVASKAASGPISLAFGANTIKVIVTAQNGFTTNTYTVTVTRAQGGLDAFPPELGVSSPTQHPLFDNDGITVRPGISPNGDGINDFLTIDGIQAYPDNKLSIMNRNGQLIYEAKGYDNSSKVFDGHSNKTGQMQLPGTYFYQLDYTVDGIVKHKTGFIVLKY